MIARTTCAICAIALLAACGRQADTSQPNQANAVMPSAETQNAATEAAPLSGDQALAAAKQREEHMETLGKATKKVTEELKSSSPNMGTIQQAAAAIADLAPRLQSWFPSGTAVGVGKSRAKPEIWQKPEDFALKAQDFKTAAQQFDVAAKSGDPAQVKMTFEALGKSCKACHDSYRAPKKG